MGSRRLCEGRVGHVGIFPNPARRARLRYTFGGAARSAGSRLRHPGGHNMSGVAALNQEAAKSPKFTHSFGRRP